jgi:sarcosine oxidase
MTPTFEFETAKENVSALIRHSNNDEQKNFDVIVLGVGSMGSSTCYYLAKQGVKVLGLEQLDIPNEMSSHGGQSRIIRKAYFEHSDYVPLLEKAYENWAHLEEISGTQVYFKTGLLYFGKPDHLLMKGVHESADKYHIKLDTLRDKDMQTEYPQLNIPNDFEKLFEPEAGFITPERAILLYTQKALQHGALIKTNVKVIAWKKTADGITVTTSAGAYFAKKIIITAGPWAGKTTPGLSAAFHVTRQIVSMGNSEKQNLL